MVIYKISLFSFHNFIFENIRCTIDYMDTPKNNYDTNDSLILDILYGFGYLLNPCINKVQVVDMNSAGRRKGGGKTKCNS